MRSLTARNDIARTIRHRAPTWDTTAIDIPVHEEARRGCGQSSVAGLRQLLGYLDVPERGTCRSLIGTQLFFRR